jgi:hypothetical protein
LVLVRRGDSRNDDIVGGVWLIGDDDDDDDKMEPKEEGE